MRDAQRRRPAIAHLRRAWPSPSCSWSLPLFGTDFFVNFVLTRTLILGLAASSIVFLSSYGRHGLARPVPAGRRGRVHDRQLRAPSRARASSSASNPWLAVVIALVVTDGWSPSCSARSASRTTGIYFLMLTLTYAVIGYYVFGQVTSISGFGGITGVNPPGFFALAPGAPLLRGLLVLSVAGLRRVPGAAPHAVRADACEGIRDDPVRMASLGFNVPLHRTLAFTLAGFVAGVAGVLNIWWNGQIDPNSVAIGPTLDLLDRRRHRRHRPPRGRLARRVRLRRRQQLPALAAARRPHRHHRGAVQHGRRAARAADRRASPEGSSGIFTGLLRPRAPGPRSARPTPATAGGPASALVIHQPTAHIQHGGTAMKSRTARRGTVVASLAVVGLTVGAGAFVADAAHPASTAPTGSAGRQRRADQARHPRRVRRRVRRLQRGRRRRRHPGDDQPGRGDVELARPPPLEGFSGAVAGGRPIEVVGVGCGDDTPDRIIQEVRTLVEQDGAEIVIGPLSGDEAIAVANYAKDHPDVTFIDGIAGSQEPDAAGAGAELLPLPRRRRAVERRARRHRLQRRRLAHGRRHRRRLQLRLDVGGRLHRRLLRRRWRGRRPGLPAARHHRLLVVHPAAARPRRGRRLLLGGRRHRHAGGARGVRQQQGRPHG